MATPCLTFVYDSNYSKGQREFVCIYRQCDGDVAWHGKELATFLNGIRIASGHVGDSIGHSANGPDCLAAQLVVHFKKTSGNIYLVDSSAFNDDDEIIRYDVLAGDDGIEILLEDNLRKRLLQGTPQQFLNWIAQAQSDPNTATLPGKGWQSMEIETSPTPPISAPMEHNLILI